MNQYYLHKGMKYQLYDEYGRMVTRKQMCQDALKTFDYWIEQTYNIFHTKGDKNDN